MMVRKEKLCEWFQALPAHKRLDYLCGLLHLCHPLELRFTGTVLEDLAKKDFHYLREQECKANQRADLSSNNSNSLSDQKLRAKIITALALMNSTNLPCAEVIFDILQQQSDNMLALLNEPLHAADLIMILTMAVHHPAFTFYQKDRLGHILERVEERLQELYGNDDEQLDVILQSQSLSTENSVPLGSVNNNQSPVSQPEKATVVSIKVMSAEPSQTKKGDTKYRIHTTWSNQEVTEVLFKFKQLQELHHKILNRFPEEKRTHASVPVFPGIQAHKMMESPSEQINALNTYFSKLAKAPVHILDCDILTEPLRSGTLVYQSKSAPNSVTVATSSHTQTVFIETSPLREDHKYEFAPYHQPIMMSYSSVIPPHSHSSPGASSGANSPATSRTSSPAPLSGLLGGKNSYSSPSDSMKGNSGAMSSSVGFLQPVRNSDQICQLLHLLNLDEFYDHLKDYPFQQVMHMSKEDFAKAGLPADAQAKLKSQLDKYKPDFNGLVDPNRFPSAESSPACYPSFYFHHPYTLIAPPYPQHFIHPFTTGPAGHMALLPSHQSPHIATNESSPANSDTSSPPPSPQQQQPVTGLLLDPTAVLPDSKPTRAANNLQLLDSSGSEEDKAAGYNHEPGAGKGKVRSRPQQSRSLPLISQGLLPVTTMEAARLTGIPISMSAVISPEHTATMTPPLPPVSAASAPPPHISTNSPAVTVVNGYISDPPPVLPHAASNVVPRAILNSRTYKTAQPAHTSLGVHKSVMNMPAPDISLSPGLVKPGAGTSNLPLLHGGLPPQPYGLAPSLASVPASHVLGLAPVNFPTGNMQLGPQPSPNQALLPEGNTTYQMLMYPRGILTTMANSSTIMTTTQSHHTCPPLSHSPSPAATAVCSDQLPAGSYISETLDASRSEGCSHTPPVQTPVHVAAVKSQTNAAGTNSATPSPPLVAATQKPLAGTENQTGARGHQQLFGFIGGFLPPVLYPQGHQPPPQYPNGITSDYTGWMRYPAQIASSHFPLVYGSVIPHQSFHAGAPSSSGPAANHSHTSGGGGGPGGGKSRCYNCGLAGHRSADCSEIRMENMSNTFHLSYKPSEPSA